jgi:hypothetical protein
MDSPAMNPLVRHGQEHRPPQPTQPLAADTIHACGPTISRWLAAHEQPPELAVLAYLTDGATLDPWVLGLSAAARGVPLIVAGEGMRWGGAGVKLPAARRAVQLLKAHAPPTMAIVFADGTDTAVANAPRGVSVASLRNIATRSDRVLVAGECNSWPVCYRPSYSRHASFLSCAARRASACYPNSGMYAGSARSLLRFLRALEVRAALALAFSCSLTRALSLNGASLLCGGLCTHTVRHCTRTHHDVASSRRRPPVHTRSTARATDVRVHPRVCACVCCQRRATSEQLVSPERGDDQAAVHALYIRQPADVAAPEAVADAPAWSSVSRLVDGARASGALRARHNLGGAPAAEAGSEAGMRAEVESVHVLVDETQRVFGRQLFDVR